MTDHDRSLEVGKTYRAVNGATVTVSEANEGDFLAAVEGDTKMTGTVNLYYSPEGHCHAIPRLNVDWNHPENNRRLEVGKTYRAMNGATITVLMDNTGGDFVARVEDDPDADPRMNNPERTHYSPEGRCYGVSRLDVDWDHPDNQRSTPVTEKRLEVGKTYRAKNGATVAVCEARKDGLFAGDFVARVEGDTACPEDEVETHESLYYAPEGECYGHRRLDVDWDHPDNQRSKAVKYDIKSMKLIFDVKGKPELAKAIAARLEELGVSAANTPGRHTVNVSVGHDEGAIHFGAMEVEDEMWAGYRLTTLDDLYNLDAWAEPEKPELPDKPSELLFLAVDDMEKTEAMPDKYKINMSEWHSPGSDTCYVCFAGGVMAQTLKVPPIANQRPFSFESSTQKKLLALDDFRKGDLASAFKRLDIDLGLELPPVFVVEYRDDPDTFKDQMRSIAYWLRRIGH